MNQFSTLQTLPPAQLVAALVHGLLASAIWQRMNLVSRERGDWLVYSHDQDPRQPSVCKSAHAPWPTVAAARENDFMHSDRSGVARFVGSFANHHEIYQLLYSDTLELYELNPPLAGYRIVAAGQSMWALRAVGIGESVPEVREDPLCTNLFGTTGGEGLQIVWNDKIFEMGGRVPARALAELGYKVR